MRAGVSRVSSSRLIVLAVSSALAGSLLVMSPVQAATDAKPASSKSDNDAPKVKPTDTDDDGTLDAADTASAVAGAGDAGKPVEDLSKRTESSTTVANPDGSFTLTDFQVPVRIKRDGDWVDVDNTLVEQSDGSFRPKASPTDVVIGSGNTKDAGQITLDDGRSVAVTWPETLPEPTVDGNVATYKISDSSDLLMTVGGGGMSARLRLNSRPTDDDPVFTFGLRTDDLGVKEDGKGGLSLTGDKGTVIGQTAPLVAWDAKTDEVGDPLEKVSLDADLERTSVSGDVTTHDLTLSTPEGFLADPETQYPVTIDPDVQGLRANSDSWVMQGNTSDHGANYDLRVGKQASSDSYPAISYIKWDLDQDRLPAGSTLLSAEMGLYQFWTGSCGATSAVVQPLSSNWAPSVLYTNRPSSLSQDYGYINTNRGSQCGNSGTVTVPATTWVNNWKTNRDSGGWGGYPAYGLRVGVPAANEGQSSYGRRFCSYQTGLNSNCPVGTEPYMKVTYNHPPNTPYDISVTNGGNPVTVYATVTDPNAEANLRVYVAIKKKATSDFVWGRYVQVSGTGSSQVSTQVPYLPDGEYTVETQAVDDNNATSAASAPKSFTVDTEFGSQSWYSTTQHQLGDRSSIQVNNRTGNLAVQAGDINVNGIGVDLGLTRFYNSQSTQLSTQGSLQGIAPWATSMGAGWSLSAGPDVWLEKRGNNYWYHAPGGTVFGPFEPDTSTSDPDDFKKPAGGVDADLTKSGTTLKMAFRHSQTRYEFVPFGSNGDVVQRFSKDRSGNRIQFDYNGTTANGRPKLSSMTDSSNRNYTVTYTGDQITKIAETGTGAREWSYGYTSGFMTSYTDPEVKVTNYTYTPAPTVTGSRPLIKIEDPQTGSNARVTTTFEYFPAGANQDRIQTVRYAKSSGTDNFSWDYARRNTDTKCDATKSVYSTVVIDARAQKTAYCFKDASGSDKANVRVYDALNHVKQTSYTADQGLDQFQAASNSTGAEGSSTAATYATGLSDQLSSVTEPKTDGDNNTAGTTSFKYGANEKYLPESSTNSNGECSSFEYNEAGQTKAAYTGLASGGPNMCKKGSKSGFHREYNGNGTVKESWDANAGETPTDDKKTLYAYFSSGNDIGQLKDVRKPGGSCDAPRKLCTSYTYDGRGRVASVTDGRGKVTTYAYDKLDRSTEVRLDGATTCPSAKCVSYTYDAEGNMTRRVDASGRTDFIYDRLNRQTDQKFYATGSTATDPGTVIGMAYDGNGNLTSILQRIYDASAALETDPDDPCTDNPDGEACVGQGGPIVHEPYRDDYVSYVYDNANRLKTVNDASGSIPIETDSDGRVSKVSFGTSTSAVNVNYDFKKSGKPKSITIKSGSTTQRRVEYGYNKTFSLPSPTNPAVFVDVTMESGQIQTRDVTDSPGNNGLGKLTYTYGDDQRLVSADNANGALPDYEYTYDKVGNITKEKIDADNNYFGYDYAGQLCWKDSASHSSNVLDQSCSNVTGATNYSSDAAGNNTGTSSALRVYNDNSQLTQNGGVTMAYSDLGNPLRTQAGTKTFLNSPLGITATKTGSDVTFFTRDPNGQILSSHGPAGTVNYVSEYNGSVLALYAPAGTELGSYRYSPYGRTTVTGAAAAANPFRYIGGHQDKDANGDDGFYKLGARYYDTQGHFTQPDAIAGSIGNAKTLTSYNYAGGDPINSSDPSGNTLEAASEAAGYLTGCVGAGSLAFGATEFAAAGGLAAIGIGGTIAATGGTALLAGTAACTGSILLKGIAPKVGDAVNDLVDGFPGF